MEFQTPKFKHQKSTVARQNLNGFGFQLIDNGSIVKKFSFRTLSEIRTFLFRFERCPKTKHPSWDTKLDCFIFYFSYFLMLTHIVSILSLFVVSQFIFSHIWNEWALYNKQELQFSNVWMVPLCLVGWTSQSYFIEIVERNLKRIILAKSIILRLCLIIANHPYPNV